MERVSQDLNIVPGNESIVEYKCVREVVTSQVCTPGGDIGEIFHIYQGTTANKRIGKKVRIRQIRARGCILSSPDFIAVVGGANTSDIVRVILYVDKQYNNAFSPFVGDLLPYLTSMSPYNQDNADRYVILDDQTFSTCPRGAIYIPTQVAGTTTGGFQSYVFINECKPWSACIDCDIPITYANGTTSDPITNNLFWIVISMGNAASTFQLNFETFYTDM